MSLCLFDVSLHMRWRLCRADCISSRISHDMGFYKGCPNTTYSCCRAIAVMLSAFQVRRLNYFMLSEGNRSNRSTREPTSWWFWWVQLILPLIIDYILILLDQVYEVATEYKMLSTKKRLWKLWRVYRYFLALSIFANFHSSIATTSEQRKRRGQKDSS